MKVGIFDFETTNLAADFGVMFCAVVKDWQDSGGGKRHILRLDRFESYKAKPWDDGPLAEAIRDLLSTYGIIVSYNGANFDLPYLQTRLLYGKKERLSAIKHVDLYYIVRYRLRMHSCRLDAVAKFLNKAQKTPILPQYWMKAIMGDKRSMNYIVSHCVADVDALEEAYRALIPFIDTIKTR